MPMKVVTVIGARPQFIKAATVCRAFAERGAGVEELLAHAREITRVRGHAIVGTEHLLLAMTRQSTDAFARRLLDELGVTEPLRSRIEDVIGEG